jgi:hypothetical protein
MPFLSCYQEMISRFSCIINIEGIDVNEGAYVSSDETLMQTIMDLS